MKQSTLRTKWAKAKTKAEKRVLIAQDVLDQITTRKIKAKKGVYLKNPKFLNLASKQLSKHLDDIGSCKACALGATMISLVRAENDWVVPGHIYKDLIGKTSFISNLRKYFSDKQLGLIESAFEKDDEYASKFCSSGKSEKAENFGYEYTTDTKRLQAIMRNIILNKGTFKP